MLVVKVPIPFPYESEKAIHWDYNCNYTHQTTVNDLTGVGGITRSERCYAPGLVEKVTLEKFMVPTSKEQSSKEKEQSFMEKKDKKTFESMSKSVTEKEACEFLKFINHSEYNVIE